MDIKQFQANNLLNLLSSNLPGSPIVKIILSLIPVIIVFLVTVFILYLLRKYLTFKKLSGENKVFLEIVPPSAGNIESYSTEQLFSLINSLGLHNNMFDKFIGYKSIFSLEIVSSADKGIRFLIISTPEKANILRKTLISYLPNITINETKDYLPESVSSKDKIIEFKLSNHFAYPLKKHELLEMHDPIAYITGMMTKLEKNEVISLQILISPVKSREAKKIGKYISRNGDVLSYLNSFKLFRMLSKPPSKRLEGRFVSHGGITDLIEAKIKQPLYNTSIRVYISSDSVSEKLTGISSSFSTFSLSDYQSLVRRKYPKLPVFNKFLYYSFKKRLTLVSPSVLSSSEVSAIFHFPYAKTQTTEDLVKSHSKDLPLPLSLKNKKHDINFGVNNFGGSEQKIGLSEDERQKHIYIIGATGTGKTTMILSMAKDDIESGKGLCIIDPHGDLAEAAVNFIPKSRIDDFIYFNPDDIKYPIGLNLLELSETKDEDELLREKELITESVISLFRKIFSEVWSAHAHRLEYILRNTIQTALCLENPNIFTVYKLLTDTAFKNAAIAKIKDENLKNFWKNEFNKAGDYQKVKMIGPITSRIGRFLFSPTAKRIMEQTKSTIDFDDILDNKKILICNLSKGKIGEDNSEVLGIMLLTKIQLSALKRARIKEENRNPFYLYVDEFQNFATPSFIQMLSEARKYKLFLTMAEQSTSQQKDRNIVNVILANVGTVISFRSANPDDEKLILPQFTPYIDKNEITNLPLHKFYMKVSAIDPEEPFSGITSPVKTSNSQKLFEEMIDYSKHKYASLYVFKEEVNSESTSQNTDSKLTGGINNLT